MGEMIRRGATHYIDHGHRSYSTYRPGLPGLGGYIRQGVYDSHNYWHLGAAKCVDKLPINALPIANIDQDIRIITYADQQRGFGGFGGAKRYVADDTNDAHIANAVSRIINAYRTARA